MLPAPPRQAVSYGTECGTLYLDRLRDGVETEPGADSWRRYSWFLRGPGMSGTAKWLALIMAGSIALALFRVSLVPILQCPDEDSHFDYAVSIYSNGGLLRAGQPPRSG